MKKIMLIVAVGLLSFSCNNTRHSSGAFDADTTNVDSVQSDTPQAVKVEPADASQVPFQERRALPR